MDAQSSGGLCGGSCLLLLCATSQPFLTQSAKLTLVSITNSFLGKYLDLARAVGHPNGCKPISNGLALSKKFDR